MSVESKINVKKTAGVASPLKRLVMPDEPFFVMSKYLTTEDLFKAKAEFYQKRYREIMKAFISKYNWLIENIAEMEKAPDIDNAVDHEGLLYVKVMFDAFAREANIELEA